MSKEDSKTSLNKIIKMINSIEDDYFQLQLKNKISDLNRCVLSMTYHDYYDILSGEEMINLVFDLHDKCQENSVIHGIQTILPENDSFLDSTKLSYFHLKTKEAIDKNVKIKRAVFIHNNLISNPIQFRKIVSRYIKPQLDAKVEITVHEFNNNCLKEHPGHDFTLFSHPDNTSIATEGASLLKSSHEAGYVSRILRDKHKINILDKSFSILSSMKQIPIPPEYYKSKPRIFIGSSVDGLRIAEHIQANLDHDADVTIWHQGIFGKMKAPLETLLTELNNFDYAILVLTPVDHINKKGKLLQVARDNVIFELGLFLGKLGRAKVFMTYCRDFDIDLPSDLLGVTVETYANRSSLSATLGPVVLKIKEAIETTWE